MTQNKSLLFKFLIFPIFIFVLIFSIICICLPGLTKSEQQVDNGYRITNYDVEMVLTEENYVFVSEVIEVYFSDVNRHGIIRTLPKKSTATFMQDNQKISKQYILKYSEINANGFGGLYDKYESNGYLCLQMGYENIYAPTDRPVNYVFTYKIDLGDDRLTDLDQFYYNIIGDNWDTTIQNVSFKVTFPKNIRQYYDAPDSYGAFVYIAQNGEDKILNPTLNSEGNVLSFVYNEGLDAFSPLTLQVKMEQGFFKNRREIVYDIVGLILCLICLTILLLVYFICKSKFKIVPVVEFSEPKGINSAEVGYLIDATIEDKDVTSLIIYWASKGYLTIKDLGKDDLLLTKIKPADKQMKNYEQNLFNKIFNNEDEVKLSQLKYQLSSELTNCKTAVAVNHDYSSFNKSALNSLWCFAVLPIIILIVLNVFYLLRVGSSINIIISFVLIAVSALVAINLIKVKKHEFYYGNKKYKTFVILSFILLITLLVATNILVWDLYCDPYFTKIFASLLVLLGCILTCLMEFRTKKGALLTGQILGLRNFIEVAEKERLEMLVNDDPSVFYHILPFAYVLGVSNVWCKKFENIKIDKPDWYQSSDSDIFSTIVFMSILNNSMNKMNNVFISTPNSVSHSSGDFGGGFGGGFSGGGIGGGGGRSW